MGKTIIRTAALVLALGVLAPAPAGAASSFEAAVERLLLGLTDGPVARMDAARKAEMVACVNGALAGVPEARKRYVAEAGDYEDLKDRFGSVVMADRAAWKQRIARACARLA